MSQRPQNTAPARPKTTQFTLLGEFEDEGVIQQSDYRRMQCMTLSEGVAQVDALCRLLEARKAEQKAEQRAGQPAAQAAAISIAISRLRKTVLPPRASVR